MKDNKELKQVNTDIIFFFLVLVQSLISFYIINEKKKSILNIPCMSEETTNKIYYYNRRLNLIISIYFFINAYNSYKNIQEEENKEGAKLFVAATLLSLIAAILYLPIGNSNVTIDN